MRSVGQILWVMSVVWALTATASAQAPSIALDVRTPAVEEMPTADPPLLRADVGLRFVANRDDVELYRVARGPRWLELGSAAPRSSHELVCVAPCETRLEPGEHVFAVALAGERPLGLHAIQLSERDATLNVRRSDRSGLRITGWAVFLAGMVLSGGLAGLAGASDNSDLTLASGIASGVVLLESMTMGLGLALLLDTTTVRFD